MNIRAQMPVRDLLELIKKNTGPGVPCELTSEDGTIFIISIKGQTNEPDQQPLIPA